MSFEHAIAIAGVVVSVASVVASFVNAYVRDAQQSGASVSAWVATDQNPSPSGVFSVGSCQNTGASRRCTAKRWCGNPAAKLSRSVKSISLKLIASGSSRRGRRPYRIAPGV